jgi:hypothetical protein
MGFDVVRETKLNHLRIRLLMSHQLEITEEIFVCIHCKVYSFCW